MQIACFLFSEFLQKSNTRSISYIHPDDQDGSPAFFNQTWAVSTVIRPVCISVYGLSWSSTHHIMPRTIFALGSVIFVYISLYVTALCGENGCTTRYYKNPVL